MKSQLKKFAALFLSVCVALSVLTVASFAGTTDSKTYTFADYKVDGELGGGAASRDLDDDVTFAISSGWFTSEARVYKNANAVITSQKDINSIVLNAGYKTSTFNVYTSADGAEWTEYKKGVAYVSGYGNVTVEFETPVKYIKLDAPNAQLRIKTLTVNFVATGTVPTPDPEPTTPTYSVVEAPVVDTAYKFGMNQTSEGKVLYATGAVNGFYMATTDDPAEAADVKLEAATGGYYLYTMVDGAKKYFNMTVKTSGSKVYVNAVFADAADCVFTVDATTKALVTNVNNSTYAFGTYGTFTTIGTADVVKYPNNYFCKLYAAETTVDPNPNPTPTPVPTTPAEIVDAAYKLEAGAKLEGVSLTGKVTEIVGAYSEQHGNITVKMVIEGKEDKPINCKWMTVENATTVEVGDTITVEGNIENNVYNNVSTIQFFRPTLKNVVKAEPEPDPDPKPEPDPDPTPSEPEADSTLTIKEAIALGEAKDKDSYTTNKYYVTGKVVDIANAVYGNLYIADEEGNELFVYGVGAEDGSKFETLDPQPKVGDTITIYGVVGKYNDIQMKNTVLKELVAGQGGTTNTDPKPDSVLTVKEAIDLALSKRHDIFTEGKYYVTGTIKEIYNEQYGNMRIVDEDGNVLTLYGTYAEDGTSFADMAVKPAVGDEITIYGVIGQYNGTAQVKNGVFKAAPMVDDENKDDDNKDDGNVDDGNKDEGNKDDADDGNVNDAPNTGDANAIFFALLAMAAAGLVLVVSKKRV